MVEDARRSQQSPSQRKLEVHKSENRKLEVDRLVRRTLARGRGVTTRAWLTAARRAVPGDAPTPTPRLVLTATRHFALRRGLARRAAPAQKGRLARYAAFPRPWPSVRRRDTPYPAPPATPSVPLIANTHARVHGTPAIAWRGNEESGVRGERGVGQGGVVERERVEDGGHELMSKTFPNFAF